MQNTCNPHEHHVPNNNVYLISWSWHNQVNQSHPVCLRAYYKSNQLDKLGDLGPVFWNVTQARSTNQQNDLQHFALLDGFLFLQLTALLYKTSIQRNSSCEARGSPNARQFNVLYVTRWSTRVITPAHYQTVPYPQNRFLSYFPSTTTSPKFLLSSRFCDQELFLHTHRQIYTCYL